MKVDALTTSIVCWVGRVLAVGLFFFWGAFFVEHLREWFSRPNNGLPPVSAWLRQAAYLAFLVGLVALWRWPVTGSILTIIGSLGFFGSLAISEAIAGKPNLLVLKFLTVTIGPALLTLDSCCVRADARAAAKTPVTPIERNRPKTALHSRPVAHDQGRRSHLPALARRSRFAQKTRSGSSPRVLESR